METLTTIALQVDFTAYLALQRRYRPQGEECLYGLHTKNDAKHHDDERKRHRSPLKADDGAASFQNHRSAVLASRRLPLPLRRIVP